MLRCNLPESITLPTGETLYPVIGGHLKQQPFLTLNNAGVDIRRNGWASDLGLSDLHINKMVVKLARHQRLKYRRVEVLHRNLRGKLDLHRSPYRPTKWVFVEVRDAEKGDK